MAIKKQRDPILGLVFGLDENFASYRDLIAAIRDIPVDRPFTKNDLREFGNGYVSFPLKIDSLWRRLYLKGKLPAGLGYLALEEFDRASIQRRLLDIKMAIHGPLTYAQRYAFLNPVPPLPINPNDSESAAITHPRIRLKTLLKSQSVLTGDFTLSSGEKSSTYFDARRVTLSSEGAALCAQLIFDLVGKYNPTAIGGPTLGADPLVGALGSVAFRQGGPLKTFIIRKEPKSHGAGKMIEGPELTSEDRIILLDDTATKGGSFIKSIKILAQSGLKPMSCVCVVDRQEGARESLVEQGIELQSLFTAQELMS